jgi:CheY-like chemotaxis protein
MTGGMRHLHENRRRHYRAKVSGRAVIHHAQGHGRDGAVRCEIDNLSLGGVALRPLTETPDLPEGTSVAVELQVDGASWVVQSGQVQRRGTRALVITFAEVSPELEDLIEDEVLAAVEAERSPRVVVVDRSEDRRSRVAAALSEVGWCPLEASTPLEAIELIEQSRTHVSAAAIGRSLTQTGGHELVHFLHDSHPEIKLALITEDDSMESVERAEVDAVLCADGRTDLSGPVRRLVGTEPPPLAPRKV